MNGGLELVRKEEKVEPDRKGNCFDEATEMLDRELVGTTPGKSRDRR